MHETIQMFWNVIIINIGAFLIVIWILYFIDIIQNKYTKIAHYFRLRNKMTDEEKQWIYNIINKYK